MPEARFQDLSPDDRRDALEAAERNSSHKAHLLEKDVWVVATLGILFDAPFAGHLTFKGGTSLSKVRPACLGDVKLAARRIDPDPEAGELRVPEHRVALHAERSHGAVGNQPVLQFRHRPRCPQGKLEFCGGR